MKDIAMVTLGCSKNDVDTQTMKGLLDPEKYRSTLDLAKAQVLIINTCGFIDAAKEESINTILDMAQLKEEGSLEKLLLAGCLAQRYPDELMEEIPEIDGIIGTGSISRVNEAIDQAYDQGRARLTDPIDQEYIDLARPDVSVTEYVKISEGCNNACSYCVIPSLKGKNRSRPMENIKEEIQDLVKRGTREVILIAQNLTDYGVDLYGKRSLVPLLRSLADIEGLKWVRLLYAYPDHFGQDLIDEFKTNPVLAPYIDIPIQHVSNRILRLMRRSTSKEDIIDLVGRLREEVPDLTIRSTLLIGFPQETQEDFEEVLDFLEAHPLDRVGAFAYSQEEGTPAGEMGGQVPDDVKNARVARLMGLQESVSERLLESRQGRVYETLITEKIEEGLYLGRTGHETPDLDGLVYVHADRDLDLDEFYRVKIESSLTHDLEGRII